METLFVPTEHRNQCYRRVKCYGSGHFGSPPTSKAFRHISCRTFQTDEALVPRPNRTYSTPVTRSASQSVSPRANHVSLDNAKSSPILINSKVSQIDRHSNGILSESRSLSNSELWAGPTYSNSPPPSSVPIPKFSLRQKRTVSLNLPSRQTPVEVRPVAKSAPASPSREYDSSVEDLFLSADSATKTLRRILNLEVDDK